MLGLLCTSQILSEDCTLICHLDEQCMLRYGRRTRPCRQVAAAPGVRGDVQPDSMLL